MHCSDVNGQSLNDRTHVPCPLQSMPFTLGHAFCSTPTTDGVGEGVAVRVNDDDITLAFTGVVGKLVVSFPVSAWTVAVPTGVVQNAPVKPLPPQSHTGTSSTTMQSPRPHCIDTHAVTCNTSAVNTIVSNTLSMFAALTLINDPFPAGDDSDTSDDELFDTAAASDAEMAACACSRTPTAVPVDDGRVGPLPVPVVFVWSLLLLLTIVPVDSIFDSCMMRSAVVGAEIASGMPGCIVVSLPSALRTMTVTQIARPLDGRGSS